jgi:choline dehydrogenase-like flavoprotein
VIIEHSQVTADIRDSADVAVVGSGCGGATVAKELAAAGLSVAIVEQGGYYDARRGDFDQREDDMLARIDGGRGLATSENGQIAMQYGNNVGGASVHYWADSWRTPPDRCAMYESLGVTGHSYDELTPYFEQIEKDLHIHPAPAEWYNTMNVLFDQGAKRLGWHVEPVHQARRNCVQSGYCMQGCAYNAKQSQLVTHIPMALEKGAKIYADCRVDRIRVDNGRARGLVGDFLDRRTTRPNGFRLHLDAKVVVLAAGGYGSPVIMLRNQLGNPKWVGKNLFLSPTPIVHALYDRDIVMWQSIPTATGTMQFRLPRYDERGQYAEGGYLLHPNQLQPALLAATLPGIGADHRALTAQLPRIGGAIGWIDDEVPGEIVLDRRGRPVYRYEVRGVDAPKIRDLLKKAALVLLASGAKEAILPDSQGTRIRDQRELAKIDALDVRGASMICAGPHPAGALRMGSDPTTSVVDCNHECHDVKNLFVCDGSAFPRPPSVDPSETIMAWSYVAAAHIKNNWQRYRA